MVRTMGNGFGPLFAATLLMCRVLVMEPSVVVGDVLSIVSFNEGMLSVSASGVPLGNLLEEVAQKTKIEVQVADEVKSLQVSSSYSGLPIKEGLIRILEDAGLSAYLLVYEDREQKNVSQLFVLKSDRTSSGTTTGSSRPSTTQSPQSSEMPGIRMSPPIMPTVPPPFPQQDGQEPFPPPGIETGDAPPPIPMPEPIPPREMNEVVPPPMP